MPHFSLAIRRRGNAEEDRGDRKGRTFTLVTCPRIFIVGDNEGNIRKEWTDAARPASIMRPRNRRYNGNCDLRARLSLSHEIRTEVR